LEVQSKRDTFIPGILSPALKDALGLSKEDQEPPYYHNMRMHGYPPAYIVDADPSKPTPTFYSVYQQPFNEDECEDLKIYDDAYIESNHEKTHKEPKETVHVKLIDYGIDFTLGIDTSKLDSAIQQYHSTYDNSYQYPTEYSQQNIAADYYAYYYSTCYDYYPAYDQYSTALPPPPAAASEPAGAVLSSSTEPALGASIPSSHLAPSPHINVSNEQTYSLVDGQANAHDDDNDSVDMDISDDDDM
jgi:hypothetical protein